MKKLFLVFITIISINQLAFAKEEEQPKKCDTYCNPTDSEGTGPYICQTICK